MNRLPLLLSVLLLLSFSTALAAPPDGVRWVRSLEDALKQAKDRGSLIFITEVIDNEVANDAQKEEFKNRGFVKASHDFVCLFADPMTNHGTVQVEVDGEKQRRCRIAPTLECRDHLKIWNEVRKNYSDLNMSSSGATKIPFHFVIDADGKVIDKIVNGTVEGGFDVVPAGAFVEVFKQLVRKFGKGISADDYEKLTKDLDVAAKAIEAVDYKKAIRLLNAVIKANERTSIADRARKMKEEIGVKGDAALAEAEAGLAEDPLGAVLRLEEVQKEFAGTAAGDKAKARLDALKEDPEVKKALAKAGVRKAAEKALAAAEDAIAAEQYAKALKALDGIAKKHAGSPVGEKAKARAAELRSDEKIAKKALEQQAAKVCRGWLSMGRSFAANGLVEKARSQYQKIIDKFPGTSYAKQAEEELAKLK